MKIFIDVSVLMLTTFITGIQRVTREITVRFFREKDMEVVLLRYHAAAGSYCKIDNEAYFNYYVLHKGRKEELFTDEKIELCEIGAGTVFFDLDAAWMCRVKRSYLLPLLKKQGARIVAHIYDIISITHPGYCEISGIYNFMDYIGAHLQYADGMIVNAHATAEELKKLADTVGAALPDCRVVPLGADFREKEEVEEREIGEQLASAVKSGPYILMVGTVEPRKNHKLLLEVYDKGLKELGYHIIFAGYLGWKMEAFGQKLRSHPDFGRGVYHFEGLGDKEIAYLYQNARFLAFCSYTEGFGLPLIESIRRGTPVLASDIPVSREVAGDYCVYFEQDNVSELCRKVEYFSRNETEYRRMKDRLGTFTATSWDQSADGMKEALLKWR